MQAEVKVNDFSGAVLVAQQGKIMYEKAFGMANREWNIPNGAETKFQIGSLTKQFTAAAILQLAEAGKLKLDDRLSKYIPDFPKGDTVTLHMLLTHTSGIKSYTGIRGFSKVAALPYSRDSVIAFFKNEPYDFSPGTKYRYNNSGYFLLGYIIEKVTGQLYSDYILNNVVKKAGLQNTSINRLDSILTNRAEGYTKTKSGWKHAIHIAMEFPYSAGAMVSTSGDLYKWNKALFEGRVVSPAMLTKMTTPFLGKYGFGLGIDSLDNHRRIGHNGGIPGFISHDVYFPAEDIHIIVLSNNSSNSSGIANALSAILFNKEVAAPYKHVAVILDSAMLKRYVGKYRSTEGNYEVVSQQGKLYRRIDGAPDIELTPESSFKFFYADGSDRQLNFVLNSNKDIRTVELIISGLVEELK
jgi:CubicO group peptidase (beta-lactamase class C family)